MKDFQPRPYQRIALDFMLSRDRCALWAGMGMGKTSTALAMCDVLHNLHGEDKPTLVLAPLRVARTTWPDEARKWSRFSSLEVVPVVGDLKERTAALKRDAPVFTTNYEQVPWLIEHWGDRWPYGQVIADESTRLKSFRLRQGGQRARALGRVAHKRVKRFVQLTGTPSPNGIADLWGQMWFLDQGGRLGRTFSAFTQRWFHQGHDGFSIVPHDHSQAEIQAKLKDICLTLDPRDWFDLREPIRNVIRVDLPKKARATYREMEREMFMLLAGGHEVEAFNAASKTIKCLQLANGAAYIDEKATEFVEVHDEKKLKLCAPWWRKLPVLRYWWPITSRAISLGYKDTSLTVGPWTLTRRRSRIGMPVEYLFSLRTRPVRAMVSTYRMAETSSPSSATGGTSSSTTKSSSASVP